MKKIRSLKSLKNERSKFVRNRIYFWIFLALLALLLISSITLQGYFLDWIKDIEQFVKDHPVLGSLAFVGLSALVSMLSLFSSAPLVPIAVLVFGNALTLVLLLAGYMIGDVIAYYLGYTTRHLSLENFLHLEKIDYYRKKLSNGAQFSLVLLFRIALPAEIAGYPMGIIRYSFGKYMLAAFIGELIFAAITVYASDALLQKNLALFAFWVIVALILIFISAEILHRKFKIKKPGK